MEHAVGSLSLAILGNSPAGKYTVIKARLFTALKLLAHLLRKVRIQELTVLPLVRLAAETFTVSSLDLLCVATSGMFHKENRAIERP